MRVVLQRVKEASVSIEGSIINSIQKGMLLFIGVEEKDNQEDIEWLSAKICKLRIFNDTEGLMNLCIKDTNGEILVISQFTLYASTKKGNRPSFIKAAKPEIAIPIYEKFIHQLETDLGRKIKTGKFAADMQIQIINDGPVTIIIDTKNKE